MTFFLTYTPVITVEQMNVTNQKTSLPPIWQLQMNGKHEFPITRQCTADPVEQNLL